ncbi:MAG: gliding motility-associated C-terminal domain-containing protein [Algoriphagus sp.]|uniref:PKD domain-containing protein n=1 Tax=Algoriphagus sp. TaxID=1872435 RepID=UPI0017D24ABF|nr:PKD domain-containing protein [Algoriphagus sp.]NVJ85433.1 gliding motility-associated C-terminal domain-containing protein [Algoriphagus sp.]
MENNRKENNIDKAVISITAREEAIGSIQYLNQTVNFSLEANEVFTHEILSTDIDILHRNSGVVEKKGVIISSSGQVSVHAFNLRRTSSDASVILPVKTLGREYLVTSHFNDMSLYVDNLESTLLIVAVEDQTRVEITPSVKTVDGKQAGVPYEILLNSQESYQLKAEGDLTGSFVRVLGPETDICKKVAVFGGNKMTQAGDCNGTADHLFQQSYPLFTWGTSFIHVPMLDKSSGELVKVLASQDGTQITVDGQVVQILNAREHFTFDFDASKPLVLEGSKPISVTAIAKSQDCDSSGSTLGDPTMISYNPNNHRIKQIVFNSLQGNDFIRHYVNIIVPSDAVDQTILNGKSVGSEFSIVPGNPAYSFARIKVGGGLNSLSNPIGLIAYAYGYGLKLSYGFSAGANFEDTEFTIESDFGLEDEHIACLGQDAAWEVSANNPEYTQFIWDFGDGSDPKSGKLVNHRFEEAGTFLVKVMASNGAAGCPIENEFEFEVVVKEIEFEILGAEQVCVGSEETYQLGNFSNLEKLEWQDVIGGSVIDQSETSITIAWQEEVEDAGILYAGYSPDGCVSEQMFFPVSFGGQSIDASPEGYTSVCTSGNEEFLYNVPAEFQQGSFEIEWFVTGGEFVSGQGESTVLVKWEKDAPEKSIYFTVLEENQSCGKVSEKLEIDEVDEVPFVNPKISGTNEVCLGTEITYSFTSETPFSTLDWRDIKGGTKVSESGNQVVIRWESEEEDMGFSLLPYHENGCLGPIVSFDVIVKESEEAAAPIGNQFLCGPEFMEMTYSLPEQDVEGEVSWVISGGEIVGSSEGQTVNVIWDSNASERWIGYLIDPTEASQCPLVSNRLQIEISDPIQISDVIETLPSCPGAADGKLEIQVIGGSGEYIFEWDNYSDAKGSVLENISAGEYKVTVFDLNSCGFDTFNLSLSDPEAMRLAEELRLVPTTCVDSNDGGFVAVISGGTPPYRVDGFDFSTDGQLITVKGLSRGNFRLFVEDAKGCALPIEGEISGPEELQVRFVEISESCPGGNFGRLAVEVDGGVGPYRYSWSLPEGIAGINRSGESAFTNNSISDMPSGEYEVMITDSNGCQVRAYGRIPETQPQVRMPTGYLPTDGLYYPVSNCSLEYTLKIFDRWGNVIYTGNEGWDGLINGKEAPTGTYTYQISYQYRLGDQLENEKKSGVFVLIR